MKKYLTLSLIILVAGCLPKNENASQVEDSGTETASPNSSLPFGTYSLPDPDVVQMQALVGGKLLLTDDCLYIGSEYIAVFPSEHTVWDPVAKEIAILGERLAIGDSFTTNGGFLQRSTEKEATLVDPIPVSCIGDTFVVVGTEAWVR